MEYISREDALSECDYYKREYCECDYAVKAVDKAIRNLPAADVAPVRRGKWVWDDDGYYCTECSYHAYGDTAEVLSGNWHFCPSCGARMELAEE